MSYPSNLTNKEWKIIEPYVRQGKMGRPRDHDIRDVINAIFYIVRGGNQWRMIPKDFPNWKTVYDYFLRWRNNGMWDTIHNSLREACRKKVKKEKSPSVAIIDSQSVKTVQKGGSMVMMQARRQKVVNAI